MKKETFLFLLITELIVAMLAMGLLMSDLGALCYLVAAAIFAVVLTPFFRKLKKTEDEAQKAKIRRNILLVMTIPIVIALAAVITVVVALMMYFG